MKSTYTFLRHIWVIQLVLAFFLFIQPSRMCAITKANADSAYAHGEYQQAIADYRELLKKGVSPQLYYNLGNAYYRTDNIAQALLAYERASLLSPGNSDIRFNLEFVRSKTIDKLPVSDDMFFITWYKSLVYFTSVDTWAWVALGALSCALLLMLTYLFADRLSWRKVGFFGGIAALAIFIVSSLFAWQQRHYLDTRTGAIVVAPSVNVKKTPVANGSDSFVLHEGTRVDIIDRSMKAWYGIRVSDGREGWLPVSQVEKI